MPSSQYQAFATGGSANALTPVAYAALTTLIANGFQTGIAKSEQVNTVLRQTTTAAAALGQLCVDHGSLDALDDGSAVNLKAAILSALNALIGAQQFWKPGDVKATMVYSTPTGWLKANGQIVSRTTYAALFAAIGTTYGVGDGSTTFAVPDLRGEFLRGLDDGRGVDSGRVIGSAQGDLLKSHTHDMGTEAGGAFNLATPVDSSGTDEIPTGNPTGATGGAETRPRNVAVLWLIKT
jgi:microcystin-dependent protein